MKLEKKHWIAIGVVLAIIAIWYFFLRKKKAPATVVVAAPPATKSTESGYNPNLMIFGGNESGYSAADIESNFKAAAKKTAYPSPAEMVGKKFVSFNNTAGHCPAGSTSVAYGSGFACVSNSN